MEYILQLLQEPDLFQAVIQNISSFVIYVYPGLISIYIYDFLRLKSTKESQALIIKSFSISYLYVIVLKAFPFANEQTIVFNAILIFISIIMPPIFYKLMYSRLVLYICYKAGIMIDVPRAPYEILKDEKEKQILIKIYLNDGNTSYLGNLLAYEYDVYKEKYIILSNYRKYRFIDGEEQLEADNTKYNAQKVLIKYNDIKIIEKIAEENIDATE